MSADLDDVTGPDPDAIAAQSFTKSRKGYEIDEVRAYLVGLSSQVREANRLQADLNRRLAELERRGTDPRELGEDEVTQLLGEETARVLDTARKAAAEIRTKAQDAADELTATTDAQATETRAAAAQYDHETRTAADDYAAGIRAAADDEVDKLRSSVAVEVAQLRDEAERVLAERTAEAETAAAAVRAEGDAYRDKVAGDADAYAADVRAQADTYRDDTRSAADGYSNDVRAQADAAAAEVRAQADAYRQETQAAADGYAADLRAQADAALQDAHAEAEATRATSDAAAAKTREQAEEDAEAIREAARRKGREMVEEAKTYRERVIVDLADRRRTIRAQLDELIAARDALAVTLTDVVGRIEASQRSLAEAVIDPRDLGEVSADRAALAGDDVVPELIAPDRSERAERPSTPDPVAAEPEPQPEAEPEPVEEPADRPAAEAVADVLDEADQAEVIEATDAVEDAGDEAAEPAAPYDLDDEDDDDDDDDAGTDGGGDGDEVVDLTDAPTETVSAVAEDDPAAAVFASLRGDVPEADVADASAESAGEGAVAVAVDTTPEAAADAASAEAGEAVETKDDPDTELLDLRDATVDELERALARRLKRVLADEQNEALDRLRRSKGTPSADAVLVSEHEHLSRYQAAALEDLTAAEREGAGFFTDAPAATVDVSDVAHQFAEELVRALRGRLVAAFDDGGDEQEIGERIRACYREWKTQRIADVATHYVLVAFNRGVAGAGSGQSHRWLVDDGGHPCPDCDDNALAGGVPSGEEFPTGDLHPPAHPGCRCLAVPV